MAAGAFELLKGTTPGSANTGKVRYWVDPNARLFQVDESGVLALLGALTPISCRIYNNADISIANSTLVGLTFNSERGSDPHGFHSTSVNTGRLTVPADLGGSYIITGSVSYASNATGVRYLIIRLNGGGFIGYQTVNAVNGADHNMTIAVGYDLVAGDYVELYVLQTSGGALNVLTVANYSPEFSIHRT